MNKGLRALSVIFLLGCLVACSGTKPQSQSESSPDSSSQGSSQGTTSTNNYEGRIKFFDFTILDLTNGVTDVNDPRYYQDSKPVDAYCRADKVKLYYLDQIDDVYYITLEGYANIFKNELAEGMTSSVTESNGVATWTIYKGQNEAYKLSINAKKKTISVDSFLDIALVKPFYSGRNGLEDYMQMPSTFVEKHPNQTKVYSFAKYNFDIFEVDGKYCYPFALFSVETSKVIERSFIYLSAYRQIVEYGVYAQVENTSFSIDGRELEATIYLRQAYDQQYGTGGDFNTNIEPETLRVFNKKLFYFIMDNYYGIRTEKGIKSMSDYFELFKESELFLDENSVKRGSAYYKALQMLNDMHTTYSYSGFFGEGASNEGTYTYSQTFYGNRTDLQILLANMRAEEIRKYNEAHGTDLEAEDVRYSSDNKYAYFSFDGFNTYTYFGEETEVPEERRIKDSYYLFVKNFNEIKAKGVKNVIIDDSINGGGYVAIMGKLLALMSKDNRSKMYLRSDDNGAIQRYVTRVDSDRNGEFDENDCFGNEFTFYIVTSNYSFSCGNAFPFYAQYNKYAKIIGQKSGGGECCVFSYTFPTGQGLTYSSPYHLGYYDEAKDVYYGDEKGAHPDYPVTDPFYNIYNVDAVAAQIK